VVAEGEHRYQDIRLEETEVVEVVDHSIVMLELVVETVYPDRVTTGGRGPV
jgi:hypothetical protein